MAEFRVINVNVGVFDKNDRVADANRAKLRAQKTFMLNVMASPGAGKTTTLLATIAALKDKYKIGVMEADIDATVDAETMANAGVRSIQVHTGGECAMDAEMTRQALEEFPTEDLDLLFLENIGNLVCPAETDTGASKNIEILSSTRSCSKSVTRCSSTRSTPRTISPSTLTPWRNASIA